VFELSRRKAVDIDREEIINRGNNLDRSFYQLRPTISTNSSTSFAGFTTTAPITSLTISGAGVDESLL
jgi:hypothetical protein